MNYSYNLISEANEVPTIIQKFSTSDLTTPLTSLKKTKKLFLSGEGSSRIFPAKHLRYLAQISDPDIAVVTEGARQAAEYDLSSYTLFGASNSGKTKEVIELFKMNKANQQFALTAHQGTQLGELSDGEFILSCGSEHATAATKSVFEQALFYHSLFREYNENPIDASELTHLADAATTVLNTPIDSDVVTAIAKADMVYFSGRNNGVAEEAALKTNEIIRKKSDYLEGTYCVHGIEEVMDKNEVVIVIDPFESEEEKIREVLVDGVGLSVIAISHRDTSFPTIKIPQLENFNPYLQLLATWQILIAVGLELGTDLDNPVRARKVGNEA